MMRKIASIVFLLTGILIGLWAFLHGFVGIKPVDAGFAKVALDRDVETILYAVWYFVSGCMLVFGAIVVWAWLRLRTGERNVFFAPFAIGVLYVVSGTATVFYHGKPFFWTFAALGGLLIVSSLVLRSQK